MKFKAGDSVRITDRLAATLNKQKRARLDWRGREGVVQTCNEYSVSVFWLGRVTVEQLPVEALELVAAQKHQ